MLLNLPNGPITQNAVDKKVHDPWVTESHTTT